MFLNHLLETRLDNSGMPKHTIAVFIDLKQAFYLAEKIGEHGSGMKGVIMVQALPTESKTNHNYNFFFGLVSIPYAIFIDGVSSSKDTLRYGVPQGSI